MNKKCARCDKTVYPTEELKCLDKTWHKQCFKCQECGMTLNMRTYKGFNKQPYCEAHIPKAKATTVAETPELRRIAENTKIQSNVMYHAEFEKAKGKFTQVADDPETLRIKQNSKIISNVAYHGDLEKKAIMEQKREKDENGDGPDMQHHPNAVPVYTMPPSAMPHHQQPPATNYHHEQYNQRPEMHAPQKHPQSGHISDYKVYETEDSQRINYNSPYNQRQSSTVIYTSDKGPVNPQPTRIVGSIADLDPLNDFHGSLVGDYRHQGGYVESGHRRPQMQQQQQQQQQQQHKRVQQQQQQQRGMPVQQQQQMTRVNQMPQHHHQPKETGRVYRAMYDYEARDADEVSFLDGDLLLGCTPIDEGWMTGTVQRTGAQGMLPANYVELAN